jgi:carbon-monoxide dehydrogenase large subunit
MIAGSQGAHRQRAALAAALRVPPDRVRVICPDVGGGFGPRSNLYPEQVVVCWAARRLGRPVRWTSDRSEAFLTDYQGRDAIASGRLALDDSGRMLALSVDMLFNVGGQTMSYVPLSNAPRVLTSVYDLPCAYAHMRGVVTNTVPTGPYRGAGRPEAIFVIERLIDLAATRLGIDRIDLRRRNLIPRQQLPYQSRMGLNYDSGDFVGNMERALELADWEGFPARRAAAGARGRLAGIGVANYVEAPVGAPQEQVQVAVSPDGTVELIVGTQSTGQGHETSFAQVVADELGVDPGCIHLVTGDTALVAVGGGTHSDRSMRFASTLIVEACRKLRDAARSLAAELLGEVEAAVSFDQGLFSASASTARLSVLDLVAGQHTPLVGEASFTGRIPAHPTGAAVCEVEVDADTGAVTIAGYCSVDDVGRPINPLILHGQVHGGIAQGLGQALIEGVVLDPGSGQVLSGSFADYAIPTASLFPMLTLALAEDPTTTNPLGVKGAGESGTTPCLAAVTNAVVDALSPLGVRDVPLPATALRIWEALPSS